MYNLLVSKFQVMKAHSSPNRTPTPRKEKIVPKCTTDDKASISDVFWNVLVDFLPKRPSVKQTAVNQLDSFLFIFN